MVVLAAYLNQNQMSETVSQYKSITESCKNLFLKKHQDYGSAWRFLRTSSLTDQIYIKAKRIRTIQETEISKVNEGVEAEFIGIYNYSTCTLSVFSSSTFSARKRKC